MNKQERQTLEALRKFSNSYTFAKVMGSNPDLCKRVIERLLNIRIKDLEMVSSEETIVQINNRGIRCDVLAYNSDSYFEVEMQTYDETHLGKRMEYYASLIETLASEKGESYDDIPLRVIIFICTYDPYNRGWAHYPFSTRRCDRDPEIILDTGTSMHIFNTATREPNLPPELANFCSYVQNGIVEKTDELVKELDSAVDKALYDEDWVRLVNRYDFDMINAEHRGRREGREEGIAEGIEQGIEQGIDIGRIKEIEALISEGILTPEQGAERIERLRVEAVVSADKTIE